MANYIASCRSNRFAVKDIEAFRAAMPPGVEVCVEGGLVVLLGADDDGGGWPSTIYGEEGDDWVDFDILGTIGEHLVEGDVAILMEAGAEKLRYIVGVASAVNHKGQTLHVNIADIYNLVKKTWEIEPTEAEY
jgi:hypothetical protein